jgi:hypothetical protein
VTACTGPSVAISAPVRGLLSSLCTDELRTVAAGGGASHGICAGQRRVARVKESGLTKK